MYTNNGEDDKNIKNNKQPSAEAITLLIELKTRLRRRQYATFERTIELAKVSRPSFRCKYRRIMQPYYIIIYSTAI